MLPPLQLEAIKRALERRSNALLSEVLDASPVRSDLRRALTQLPHMTGGAEILRIAEHECAANENALAALDHVSAVHRYVEAMGCAGAITYDLAMLRGMAYYSGIMFEAFAPGIGSSIMSGGRYDKLLSHFGRDLPALGFAIGVERTLAALSAERGTEVDLTPYALAEIGASQEAAIRIERARRQGTRVELMLSPHSHSELIAFARERGAREVWFSDGTVEGLG